MNRRHWPIDDHADLQSPEDERLVPDEGGDAFHIGQTYERKTATPMKCGKCGGRSFEIGKGDYYTAIRCVVCRWEHCEHEG